MLPRLPTSTLFPYTTLFRSGESEIIAEGLRVRIVLDPSDPQKPSGVGSGPTPPELKKHRRFLIFLLVGGGARSEEHTSELQSHVNLVCRLLLEKKNESSYVD